MEMTYEERIRIKRRLERLLSEVLSDKFDSDITITFKPEKDDPAFINRNGGLAE